MSTPATTPSAEMSWFAVSEEVKALLSSAADHWGNPAIATNYIQQALTLAEGNLDVLIAAYRYFFYTQNYPLALQVAQTVTESVKQAAGLPEEWQQLQPILLARREDPQIRLYLQAYSASGLVLAKLGEIESAIAIATNVKEIDANNEFSADVIFKILTTDPEADD